MATEAAKLLPSGCKLNPWMAAAAMSRIRSMRIFEDAISTDH